MSAAQTNSQINSAGSNPPASSARRGNLRATVALILASGGDTRIWPDPISGRNRYGTKTSPAPEEIGFASTTASNITTEGFEAASQSLQRLFGADGVQSVSLDLWFNEIRTGISEALAPGSEIVLAASGTDAELLTLGLVTALSSRPLTNVFIAPDETGKGIPLAASGRHFSGTTALAQTVAEGQPIEGFAPERIDVRTIAIRDDSGRPRNSEQIDRDVAAVVEQELRRGRDILLHVLDTSKTGLTGPSRETARALAGVAPGRVRVVIDACQLRCPLSQLRRDLADGFMVTITGSKFVGGPAFAGALLLPRAIVIKMPSKVVLPGGLANYTAALDWPACLRDKLEHSFKSEGNIGLGLRWIAALDNLKRYAAVAETRHRQIIDHFADHVRSRISAIPGFVIHPDDDECAPSRSIISVTPLGANNNYAPSNDADRIRLMLLDPALGPVCHVGQPVRIGPRTVLRISASARDVADIAARMQAGQSLDTAFAPVGTNLDVLFAKWEKLARLSRAA